MESLTWVSTNSNVSSAKLEVLMKFACRPIHFRGNLLGCLFQTIQTFQRSEGGRHLAVDGGNESHNLRLPKLSN